MDPKQLEEILNRSLAPLAARLDKLEATRAVPDAPGAAAAPEPKIDPEVERLRAQVAELKAAEAARYAPEARGPMALSGPYIPTRGGQAMIDGLCRSIEAEPAHSVHMPLVHVIRSKGFMERRLIGPADGYEAHKQMRNALESDLFALLNAAVDSGLIAQPSDFGSWA